MQDPSGTAAAAYTVSELNELLRALIEESLPQLWVEGEISNFSRPASGHWYFTLKDAGAQIRCAMFRNTNMRVRLQPANGDQVRIRARAGVYPARGELQLIVEHLEPAGSGALLRAFEALKARLAAEGLFDSALKRPIPALPRRIGIITSPTGAALQDVRHALARRWPMAEVVLAPVPVQGAESAPAIVSALSELPARVAVDVVLLVRGGGSIEDLWSFNEEAVARAIRACAVPVICGVGHEIDFTIADFAADLRAPTPTAAAELATPDQADWLRRIDQLDLRLQQRMQRSMADGRRHWQLLAARLQRVHPGRRLEDRTQRLDDLDRRLRLAAAQRLTGQQQRLAYLSRRLAAGDPRRTVREQGLRLARLRERLLAITQARLDSQRSRVSRLGAMLDSLGPQRVLARGYAIVTNAQGLPVVDPAVVEDGARIDIRVAGGHFGARRSD